MTDRLFEKIQKETNKHNIKGEDQKGLADVIKMLMRGADEQELEVPVEREIPLSNGNRKGEQLSNRDFIIEELLNQLKGSDLDTNIFAVLVKKLDEEKLSDIRRLVNKEGARELILSILQDLSERFPKDRELYSKFCMFASEDILQKHCVFLEESGVLLDRVVSLMQDLLGSELNGKDAKLSEQALQKFAAILHNVDSEMAQSLLDKMPHDALSENLVKILRDDLGGMLDAFRQEENLENKDRLLTKICFLMNFLDGEDLQNFILSFTGKR